MDEQPLLILLLCQTAGRSKLNGHNVWPVEVHTGRKFSSLAQKVSVHSAGGTAKLSSPQSYGSEKIIVRGEKKNVGEEEKSGTRIYGKF